MITRTRPFALGASFVLSSIAGIVVLTLGLYSAASLGGPVPGASRPTLGEVAGQLTAGIPFAVVIGMPVALLLVMANGWLLLRLMRRWAVHAWYCLLIGMIEGALVIPLLYAQVWDVTPFSFALALPGGAAGVAASWTLLVLIRRVPDDAQQPGTTMSLDG
jgi:hypothetical protein